MSIRNEIISLYGGSLESDSQNNHELWLKVYRGENPWTIGDNLRSLNLGATIANRLGQTATIELVSKLNDEDLDKDYQVIINKLSQVAEYGLALGGVIIKPYPVGERIAIDVVMPDMFIPLEIDNFDELKKVVFIDRYIENNKGKKLYYTRIELHNRGQIYTITNDCYLSKDAYSLGEKINIEEVDHWKGFKSQAIVNSKENLYGYFKNPQANNLDPKNPLGISCYARALSLMQDADEQYNRFNWEFESKETAIDADITMFKSDEVLPKHQERLFRKLNASDEFYKVYSPDIRDQSLINGLNEILKKIEDVCQLSRGTLSNVEHEQKTATEVKASKQLYYATVSNIQKNLEACLRRVVRAIEFWTNKKLEVTFEWDDSIVIDSSTEREIRLKEVGAGLLKPEAYLAWRYGVSEEEAKKMLPSLPIDDDLDDIEIAKREADEV